MGWHKNTQVARGTFILTGLTPSHPRSMAGGQETTEQEQFVATCASSHAERVCGPQRTSLPSRKEPQRREGTFGPGESGASVLQILLEAPAPSSACPHIGNLRLPESSLLLG